MLRLLLFLVVLSVATPAGALTVGFLPGAGELDSPFNELAYMGLAKAEDEFACRLVARQGLEGRIDDAEAAQQMQALLETGVDVVVANGVEWAKAVQQAAEKHPELLFIAVEARLEPLPNVVSVLFANEEGGFLAGSLAGYASTTGMVGFIGGVDIPSVRAFRHGYAQGLRHAAPEAEMLSRYVSRGEDFSGFFDADAANELAMQLFEQGVDIVFPVAGEAGIAVLAAAEQQDRYAIGVDYDQGYLAKGHVLASVVKRVDKALFEELQRVAEDQFQPGEHIYGLRDGGIALQGMDPGLLPQAVQERLLEVEEKIRHGVIKVETLNY